MTSAVVYNELNSSKDYSNFRPDFAYWLTLLWKISNNLRYFAKSLFEQKSIHCNRREGQESHQVQKLNGCDNFVCRDIMQN